MDLNDKIYDDICELCERGDGLCEEEKYFDAIDYYFKALKLLPDPKSNWEASTWIYTAIGESYFYAMKYIEALDFLNIALICPNGNLNPLINLRIGQCFYETGDVLSAKEYLLRAYMLDGEEIFDDEDKKYINLLDI